MESAFRSMVFFLTQHDKETPMEVSPLKIVFRLVLVFELAQVLFHEIYQSL